MSLILSKKLEFTGVILSIYKIGHNHQTVVTLSPAIKYAALPAGSAILVLLRWIMQGTNSVWSKLSMQLYVPDDDLGWRRTKESFAWLGLDALVVLVGITLGVGLLVHLLARRGRFSPTMQKLLWPLLAG